VLLFMAVGKLRLGFETNRRTLLMTGGEWEQASVDPVSRYHGYESLREEESNRRIDF